jgi:hypothetical protein
VFVTLADAFGVLGGLVFAVAAGVAAFGLGYGVLVVVCAVPAGFLFGWLVGVGVSIPVGKAIASGARAEQKTLVDDESDNDPS